MSRNIFFSADHHFGHNNIIKYCNRPFASTEEMNEELVKRWNSVVGINDIVHYLGDFSLSKNLVEPFAARLNGEKHLVMGNHDTCHPTNKKKAEIGLEIYKRAGFKTIQLEAHMDIAGQSVLLHHMPYVEEEPKLEYKIRFHKYRPIDNGGWLLHGHVHEKWKTKDHMVNVGVDVWDFYPVSITQIEHMISPASNNLT